MIDNSAVARVVGVETNFRDFRAGRILFLPQRIAVLAQGSESAVYSINKFTAATATEVGQRFGFGSPAHLAAVQIIPNAGAVPVTIYPLMAASNAAAATATIEPQTTTSTAGTLRVTVGGVTTPGIGVPVGTDVATLCTLIADMVNTVLTMPVEATATATTVTLTAKWAAENGNDLVVTVDETQPLGADFVVGAFTGGVGVPDLSDALAQFGSVWETFVVNAAAPTEDSATLDALQAFGDSRTGAEDNQPFVAFSGYTGDTVAGALAIANGRELDRINALITVPGSDNLPFQVAARAAAAVARVAQNNPARDYAREALTGIAAGADGDEWIYPQRQQAVVGGVSTTNVAGGTPRLSDVVTFYRGQGEDPPAFRHVCDIVKLNNVIFNVALRFNSTEWDGAPLVPDGQATENPDAKTPKDAKATYFGVIDDLALQAIISDPAFSKENTIANINSQNPKRLDLRGPVKLSGNANIISATIDFGFFFG